MRDKHGNPVPNAHLVGLFNRICKLLYYGIKPVFVFDGGVPHLKKKTLVTKKLFSVHSTDMLKVAKFGKEIPHFHSVPVRFQLPE